MCVFCQKQDHLIYKDTYVKAFYDRFPVSKGHLLIVPNRHTASYFNLTPDEKSAMDRAIIFLKSYIDAKYQPDGYNIGVNIGAASGQTVFHVHIHMIPRYEGDVAHPRGGVRGVIPSKQDY